MLLDTVAERYHQYQMLGVTSSITIPAAMNGTGFERLMREK